MGRGTSGGPQPRAPRLSLRSRWATCGRHATQQPCQVRPWCCSERHPRLRGGTKRSTCPLLASCLNCAAQAGGLRMLTAARRFRFGTTPRASFPLAAASVAVVAEAKCSIGVDQSWPMPIEFTQTAGTETATWELRVRPVGSDASDGQHLPWKAARLRRWTPRFALLVCDSEAKADEASAEAGGESKSRLPWIAVVCVHDQLLPVASEAAVESDPADPTGLSGEATAEDVSRMEPAAGTAGSARELRRFGLPPSEILVERMCCLLRQQCTADMAQLYITSGFLCYEQTNKHEAVAWSEVDAIYAPRGLGRKDEIVASPATVASSSSPSSASHRASSGAKAARRAHARPAAALFARRPVAPARAASASTAHSALAAALYRELLAAPDRSHRTNQLQQHLRPRPWPGVGRPSGLATPQGHAPADENQELALLLSREQHGR